jgi:hypothetical protein
MKLFGRTKTKPRTEYVPQAEDFTHKAIQKAVLKESLEHPLTIYPFVISLISLLYMIVIGLDIQAFTVSLGSGALGIGSWIYQYFINGTTLAEEHVQTLRKLRQKNRFDEIDSLRNSCRARGFNEGTQAARELKQVYERLYQYLHNHEKSNDLHVQHFIVLAEDAFEKGITMLNEALQTFLALKAMDHEKLTKEIKEWKNELASLENSSHGEAHIKALTIKVRSNEKRLTLFEERSDEIHYLLAECERIEGALDTSYLQVIEYIERDPEHLFKGDAVAALERAVTAASEVEKRLKQRLIDNSDRDEEYLEAGKNRINLS